MIGFRNVEFRGIGRGLAVTGYLALLEFQFIESSQGLSKGVPSKSGTSEAKDFDPSVDPCQQVVFHGHLYGFHSYFVT